MKPLPGKSQSKRTTQGEDSCISGSMCPSDKENWSYDNGEAYQTSSYTMPCKGLENLKRDNQVLVTGVTLPQWQYYALAS